MLSWMVFMWGLLSCLHRQECYHFYPITLMELFVCKNLDVNGMYKVIQNISFPIFSSLMCIWAILSPGYLNFTTFPWEISSSCIQRLPWILDCCNVSNNYWELCKAVSESMKCKVSSMKEGTFFIKSIFQEANILRWCLKFPVSKFMMKHTRVQPFFYCFLK